MMYCVYCGKELKKKSYDLICPNPQCPLFIAALHHEQKYMEKDKETDYSDFKKPKALYNAFTGEKR